MALPTSVSGREVIIGGGAHAAIYAATRRAMGFGPPIVLEKVRVLGGVFAQTVNFGMNSANWASVASVASPGPTRITPMSATDDLNYLPNSMHQVRDLGMDEYPHSFDMAKTIRRTLQEYAETYLEADALYDSGGGMCTKEGFALGRASRILFAGGLTEPRGLPSGRAIMSGYAFMKSPVRDLTGKKIALIGGGDTAAQCAEIMLGLGITKPRSFPSNIHWFGSERMPTSKGQWMDQYHARFAGLGRHFPQDGMDGGPVRPFPVRGDCTPLGNVAMVNGEVFDLVIMATGFAPADCPVGMLSQVRIGGITVARCTNAEAPLTSRVFKIGASASIAASFRPYPSRFPAAQAALYSLGPRTAALAAALPR